MNRKKYVPPPFVGVTADPNCPDCHGEGEAGIGGGAHRLCHCVTRILNVVGSGGLILKTDGDTRNPYRQYIVFEEADSRFAPLGLLCSLPCRWWDPARRPR